MKSKERKQEVDKFKKIAHKNKIHIMRLAQELLNKSLYLEDCKFDYGIQERIEFLQNTIKRLDDLLERGFLD